MWRASERMRPLPIWQEARPRHREGESPFLTSAKLKLVDGCNLRCFMCDYWHGRREGELSTEEVRRALADLRALGCEKVHFTGGEIFLRADALALLEEAARLGMRVNLTTNGTLLDKDRARALLDIPVKSVTLSVDSPSPRVHDALRGREGAHRKTTRALDLLLRYRSKRTRVRVNTVVSALNSLSLLEMPGYLSDRPVDGWLLIPMDVKEATRPAGRGEGPHPVGAGRPGRRLPLAGEGTAAQAMTREDLRAYNAHVAPALAEGIRIPGFDPYVFGRSEADLEEAAARRYALGHYRRHACHVPWFHTLIGATGDVYPCCMGHRQLEPLGNVREAPLLELWNGPRYVAFRRAMREARPAICHHCDDFLAENRDYDALVAEREGEP